MGALPTEGIVELSRLTSRLAIGGNQLLQHATRELRCRRECAMNAFWGVQVHVPVAVPVAIPPRPTGTIVNRRSCR